MAILDVTEYASLALDAQGRHILVGKEPSITTQQVAIGGGSTQSVALQGHTKFVRLHTDAACRVAIGPNPTAAATSMRMAANQTEYLGVNPGDKIAVITTT